MNIHKIVYYPTRQENKRLIDMQFIQGTRRSQTYFSSLEDQVSSNNAVRLIDAFVDKLDLKKLGFLKTIHKSEGRPPYVLVLMVAG